MKLQLRRSAILALLVLLAAPLYAQDAGTTQTAAMERQAKMIDLSRREAALLQKEKDKIVADLQSGGTPAQLPEFTSGEFLVVAENASDPADQLKRYGDAIAVLQDEIKALKELGQKVYVERTVRTLEREVAELRGLELKHSVDFDYLSPEDLKKFLDKSLDKQFPNNSFGEYEFAVKRLGLIPPDVNLRELIVSLYAEQIGGLFDDATRKLFVMRQFDLTTEIAKIILAHEICHALQDQHYTLANWSIHEANDDDQALAASAILEGDAMVLMMEWTSRNATWKVLFDLPDMMSMNQQALKTAPPSMVEMLIFPYVAGMEFLQIHKLTDTPADYEKIFRDPPQSTEQILHPDKYFGRRDEPNRFRLQDYAERIGPGWQLKYENSMGEIGARLCLTGKPAGAGQQQVAEGWDGDRYYLYRSPDGADYLLLWASIWDREEDAIEFTDAWDKVYQGDRKPLQRIDLAGEFRAEYEAPHTMLRQEGVRVLLTESNSQALTQKISRVVFEDFLRVPEKR